MTVRKTKHLKIRNTGLLFEFLVRELTSDIFNNNKSTKSIDIIKRRFNENTELGKELDLYNVLLNKKFKSDKKADFLISEVLKSYKKINTQKLKREKYNLIKEIKNSYDLVKFLSSKVDNYKVYASIYKLFENKYYMKPDEKTEVHFTILEYVTSDNKISVDTNLKSLTGGYKKVLKDNSDVRILSYKILLEKFNKKYKSLDANQKKLLRCYINNITNTNSLMEYIDGEIPVIKKSIGKFSKSIEDEVVKIKLNEAVNSIENLCKRSDNLKNVNDSAVVQMMRYYELVKELKK
tara:strand:+ start:2625 stop:3503 length:879 start_codon:yes stop_codon:yes gene_type:complete